MPIIDSHVHLYPPEVNRDPAGWAASRHEAHWSALSTRRRANGACVQGFPDVSTLLRSMDAAGVARAVLLGWYWENHDTCVGQNQFYAECIRAHPDRLSAFATLQPAAGPVALKELRRACEDGLVGLGELSPHSQHVPCDSAVLADILSLAGELELPVNLHVTDHVTPKYPGRVETPLEDFEQLAIRHPSTTFILAHWAGGLDVRQLPNVWVDTAAAPLIYGPESWSRFTRTVPPDRILFGSDYPLNLYPNRQAVPDMAAFVREADAAALTPAEREAVLGGNAARLLDLPSR